MDNNHSRQIHTTKIQGCLSCYHKISSNEQPNSFLYGTTSKEKESSSRPYITLALHSSGCLLNLQELQQELYSSVVFPVFGRAPCRERIVTASSTISRSGIPILSSGGGECQWRWHSQTTWSSPLVKEPTSLDIRRSCASSNRYSRPRM